MPSINSIDGSFVQMNPFVRPERLLDGLHDLILILLEDYGIYPRELSLRHLVELRYVSGEKYDEKLCLHYDVLVKVPGEVDPGAVMTGLTLSVNRRLERCLEKS